MSGPEGAEAGMDGEVSAGGDGGGGDRGGYKLGRDLGGMDGNTKPSTIHACTI